MQRNESAPFQLTQAPPEERKAETGDSFSKVVRIPLETEPPHLIEGQPLKISQEINPVRNFSKMSEGEKWYSVTDICIEAGNRLNSKSRPTNRTFTKFYNSLSDDVKPRVMCRLYFTWCLYEESAIDLFIDYLQKTYPARYGKRS